MKNLSDNGTQWVDYSSGRRNRARTAVDRALFTGMAQIRQHISEQQAKEINADGMEISFHHGFRPSHGFGGLQFSTGEYNKGVWSDGKSVSELLRDYNCRHRAFPIIMGISKPVYSKEELQKLNDEENRIVQFEGKPLNGVYEMTQKQRQLEQAIRSQKERIVNFTKAGDFERANIAKEKLKQLNARYDALSQATGLPSQPQRTETIGYSEAMKALRGGAANSSSNSEYRANKRSGSKWTGGGRTPEEIGRAAAKIPKQGVTTTEINISGDDEKVFTIPEKRGIIDMGGGKSSAKIGDADSMTTITDIKPIDFNDEAAIKKEIDNFAKKYAYADVEHALVISPDGNVYSLTGTKINVNSSLVGRDTLIGSIGTHNHPVPQGDAMGDSFSKQDLGFAIEYKTGKQYLISGERKNAFEYAGDLTREDIEKKYDEAFMIVRSIALETGIDIYSEQQQIMEKLNEELEGFVFYGRF